MSKILKYGESCLTDEFLSDITEPNKCPSYGEVEGKLKSGCTITSASTTTQSSLLTSITIESAATFIPYVKMTASGSQTVKLTSPKGTFEYSYDNSSWNGWSNPSSTTLTFGTTEQPSIYLRGKIDTGSTNGVGRFQFGNDTSLVDVEGNAMALLDWENSIDFSTIKSWFLQTFYSLKALRSVSSDFLPATTLAEGCYNGMFDGCTSLQNPPELPATTLAENCYQYMFSNCSGLTSAPSLPATTLTNCCYAHMFRGCTKLTSAPSLPATTLADSCYSLMFQGCTSLTSSPDLPATTLTQSCYDSMFYGCTSLTSAPSLPATTLAQGCYYEMFNGCTKLTSSPVISATTLAKNSCQLMFNGCTSLKTASTFNFKTLNSYCCASMFASCTGLTSAPSTLPATTLASGCYYSMFGNCKSLVNAPELPATTLVETCYSSMFKGCTQLKYVKIYATNNTTDTNYLSNWLSGVASSGDFYYKSASSYKAGASGIPSGWTKHTF